MPAKLQMTPPKVVSTISAFKPASPLAAAVAASMVAKPTNPILYAQNPVVPNSADFAARPAANSSGGMSSGPSLAAQVFQSAQQASASIVSPNLGKLIPLASVSSGPSLQSGLIAPTQTLPVTNPVTNAIPVPSDVPATPDTGGGGGGGGGGSSDDSQVQPDPEVPFYDNQQTSAEVNDTSFLPSSLPSTATNNAIVQMTPMSPATGPLATVPKPVVTTQVVAPSFIDKLLAWFGLSRATTIAAKMAGEAADMATMSRTDAAQSLVRRARNGDQNAMAIMAMVRDGAAKGNAQAKISMKLMLTYAKDNPEDPLDAMGADTDPVFALGVKLSHGPKLFNSTIEKFKKAHFGDDEDNHNAFDQGMIGRDINYGDKPVRRANKIGLAVAHARRLQGVRMDHTEISSYNGDTGWELGE